MITAKCGKCGRLIEVTEQEAARLDGMLVCPQCLNTVEVDAPRRSKRHWCHNCGGEVEAGADFCRHCGEPLTAKGRKKQVAPPPPPPPTKSKPNPVPTPPPYRPKTQPKSQPQIKSQATTMPADKPRQSAARQSAKKEEPKKPLSSKGCLLISVVITLAVAAVYYFLGVIFD